MSKPGFYNDNEYRAYPFIYNDANDNPAVRPHPLPDETIVDAGFIVGLDAEYDDVTDRIYLAQLVSASGNLIFKFRSTSSSAFEVIFQRSGDAAEWLTEYSASGTNDSACAQEPMLSGFLVTGKLEAAVEACAAAGGVIDFPPNAYVIEPARVQNLNKSYLRSVSVGNYARTVIPPCSDEEDTTPPEEPEIIWNAQCVRGPIRFKEGYNAKITQISRSNELVFTAQQGAGAKPDAALCANYGEIPLTEEELTNKPIIYEATDDKPEKRSKFLSGGWSCKDLIFTINGLGGSNVNLVGGKNIQIGYSDEYEAITVKMLENAQGQCGNG
jgi:hypothetical protein